MIPGDRECFFVIKIGKDFELRWQKGHLNNLGYMSLYFPETLGSRPLSSISFTLRI